MKRGHVPLALGLLLAGPAVLSAAPQTAPYTYLDNVEGEWVSTNAVPIRPIALASATADVYAVSTQANTVVHFDPTGAARSFSTPRGPVSVALWDHDPNDGVPESRVLVVCAETYALAVLDRLTGATVGYLELRDPATGRILSEPQDLLVDTATDTAFVSSAGSDAVAEIDLPTLAVVRTFKLPAKNPVFMAFDGNKDVLVAPMISGNNSAGRREVNSINNPQQQGPTVLDFLTMALNGTRLPDEDLFRCVRSSGAVQAVTRDVGTLQFGVGIHPGTGQVWQLNTEANNKDPNRQGIAELRGDFVQNRLSISDLPAVGQPANTPATIVDLDKTNPGFPYDPTRTVGQPYALTFVNNLGVITGLLTDNVTILDSAGNFVLEFDLPPGSIPRGVVFSPLTSLTLVYCWGTNKIEVYTTNLAPTRVLTLDLGFDPTPQPIQAGRRILYDAFFSQKNNMSCVSCHVEMKSDMIVWDLSNKPTDDKGPMLTQSMTGIQKLGPLHWRGELSNGLADFRDAFVNNLGSPVPLSKPQFEHVVDYIYSIQGSPNPLQNEARIVDDALQPLLIPGAPPSRATLGQTIYEQECETCHNHPLGTNNGFFGDGSVFEEENPRRQKLRVNPFTKTFRREQDADPLTPGTQIVNITLPSLTGGPDEDIPYPILGASNGHVGLSPSLNARVNAFALTQEQISDVTGFIYQFDYGLAPATFRSTFLDQTNHASVSFDLQNYFVPQADQRNCDLVVYGESTIGGSRVPMRWYYDRDRAPNGFVAEDSSVSDKSLSFFLTQAQNGEGSNVFMGVPVGMGIGIGVDFDGDDLFNADETSPALGWLTDPFDPDVDGDGWPDGHEAKNGGDPNDAQTPSNDVTAPVIEHAVTQFVSGRVARINVETDEPCEVTVAYSYPGGPPQSQTSVTPRFARTHSILLDDLLPSTDGSPWITYDGTVTATDHAGNTAVVGLPTMPSFNLNLSGNPPGPITTRNHRASTEDTVVGRLAWERRGRNVSGNGLNAIATVRADRQAGGPPPVPEPGVFVVARIFKNNEQVTDFRPTHGSSKLAGFDYTLHGNARTYTGLPGPFLLSSLTDDNGEAQFGFSLRGLKPGDRITLNIELIVKRDPSYATFTVDDIRRWVMAATKPEHRSLEMTM